MSDATTPTVKAIDLGGLLGLFITREVIHHTAKATESPTCPIRSPGCRVDFICPECRAALVRYAQHHLDLGALLGGDS